MSMRKYATSLGVAVFIALILVGIALCIGMVLWTDRSLIWLASYLHGGSVVVPMWLAGVLTLILNMAAPIFNVIIEFLRIAL